MNFVVLSSSRGTTFQAVLERIADGSLSATCLGLISDREDRGCVDKARAAGIPVSIVEHHQGEEREDYDKRLNAAIHDLGKADVLCALGWMFLLSAWFIAEWPHRIINVHPSLLPKYPGAHAIKDAIVAGETKSGMTIHVIDEGVDTGLVLLQKSCAVSPDDTEDSLKKKIQDLEKKWYPLLLQKIATGGVKLP